MLPGAMRVLRFPWPRHQIPVDAGIQDGDQRLEQVGLHPLAAARLCPHLKRQERADSRIQAGDEIGHVGPGEGGGATALARHAGQAAHALDDLVEGGPADVRALGPEARDGDHDQAGVLVRQDLVAEAYFLHRARTEVFDHDVRLADQPPEQRESLR
jgi:hypothetical protein